MTRYGVSQRQACAVLRISRSVYGYRSKARDARPLVQRIKEIAATRVHWLCQRSFALSSAVA
jgi:putative transposase